MSKVTATKCVATNSEAFCKSTFTLTFAVEVVGLDVWHDCNEGWLDLGPCYQAMKMQYHLYPGQSFDVDILVWPHVVKVWCGAQYGWVRTWQYLERRWFAFSIRHAFPVRVAELWGFTSTVTPSLGFGSLGANAKNDKNLEIYLPKLRFGEKRYFAGAIDSQEGVNIFVRDLIWKSVETFIPSSYLDGSFDTPLIVSDARHQDAVIEKVQATVLARAMSEEEAVEPEEASKPRERRESKYPKEKEKKKIADAPKCKYEIKLSGNALLSAAGRVSQYETVGDRPLEQGEVIVLIGTSNLPAQDDLPIIFVNIGNITDLPAPELRRARITHLYTRWNIGGEHESEKVQLSSTKTRMSFNDQQTLLLEPPSSSLVKANFSDNPFIVELRGTRAPSFREEASLYSGNTEYRTNAVLDVPIAVARVDASPLSKGNNTTVRGEFPLYPPHSSAANLRRDHISTNDMNGIGRSAKPDFAVQPSVILEAQTTLEVSLGFVGCKPRDLSPSYSRLFCIVRDPDAAITVVRKVTEINDEVLADSERERLLTGFAADVGERSLLCVEGRRHGPVLQLWHTMQQFSSKVNSQFSSSSNYGSRLYTDLVSAPVPFVLLKMYAPLAVLLACPQAYVSPTLPLPARSALLKFGRLLSDNLRTAPCRNDLPTSEELKSFRLELCSPPRPGACLVDINLVPSVSTTRPELLLKR